MTDMNSENYGQVLVTYSDTRKRGMQLHGREDCSALITLVKLIMEKNNIEIEGVKPHKDSFSDLEIDFKTTNSENLNRLRIALKELIEKKVGAKTIDISLSA